MLNYFDVIFDAGTGDVRLVQKVDIGPESSMSISIPVKVTMNTVSGGSQRNGFNANISAGASNTFAGSSASEFTFTNDFTGNVVVTNDDNGTISGSLGGVAIADIIDNDTFNGSSAVLGTNVRITSITNTTPLEVNSTTGEVSVLAGTAGGTYVESYRLCEESNLSNCDDANITVVITTATPIPIVANNDNGTISGAFGGVAIADITDNDTLGGALATLGTNVEVVSVTKTTPLEVNTTTGQVSVVAGTTAGTYVERYRLCEKVDLSNCNEANITVVVTTVTPIIANDDNGTISGVLGGIAIADITDNDILNGSSAILGTNVEVVSVTNTTPLEVNSTTGQISVMAGTASGTYVERYRLCEKADLSNCNEANITVVVTTVTPIVANDDNGTINGDTGGIVIADITDNDTLNGSSVTLGTHVRVTSVTNTTPLDIDTLTGRVTVHAGTTAGTYVERYRLCEEADLSNCSEANITVVVTTVAPIVANNDNGTGDGDSGSLAIADITDNDTLSGAAVTLGGDVEITSVTSMTPLEVNSSTGEVRVSAGTLAGTYVESYRLCEKSDLINCNDANITVVVTRNIVIVANDDNGTVEEDSGGVAITDITDNDTLNGNLATLGGDVNIISVTNTTPLQVSTTTGQVSVPAGTTAGTYIETYILCQKTDLSNCDMGDITVTVVKDLLDTDGDNTPDMNDTDDDNDGISDVTEGSGDADGDNIPNSLDTDSDGDGIPDKNETTEDTDNDGKPNYLDTDSDGDGTLDTVESTSDSDGDGVPDYLDSTHNSVDSDGDAIPDSVEGSNDTDNDGKADYLDTDSDGDGILDSVESSNDTDGDGKANYLDLDSDGDGIPDINETAKDIDGDGTPNYLDLDSDGDGVPDKTEGLGDSDGDGIPNSLDADDRSKTLQAVNDKFVVTHCGPVSGSVGANDVIVGTNCKWELVTAPTNGVITLESDGTYVYIRDENFQGSDSFTYSLTNDADEVSIGTVNVEVVAPQKSDSVDAMSSVVMLLLSLFTLTSIAFYLVRSEVTFIE
jgi:hypothetical protein